MRAFAIDAIGEPGSIRELPDPEPGEGEVVVAVQVAGMNQTDIAVMAGFLKDFMEHRFPLVIGIDASGVVERVGPGVEHFREGDEVYCVVPQVIERRGWSDPAQRRAAPHLARMAERPGAVGTIDGGDHGRPCDRPRPTGSILRVHPGPFPEKRPRSGHPAGACRA
jgi:NADPH:quinone reductase-like Zn-dependent oxidoreductase